MNQLKGCHRHDVIKLLKNKKGNIGVELGVAEGLFSSRMVSSGFFSNFFGIDKYDDRHDVNEYKKALKQIGLFSDYSLLKMTFEEAYDLFDDESLDFIYIDGYAHNGENGGTTIFEWSKKVKIGGVISGDDYHEVFPLVVEAVDEFVKLSGFYLHIATEVENNSYSYYPSWAVIKQKETSHLFSPLALVKKGSKAKRPRIKVSTYIKVLVSNLLPKKFVNFLKKYL